MSLFFFLEVSRHLKVRENLAKLKPTVKTSFCITIKLFKHGKNVFILMIIHENMKVSVYFRDEVKLIIQQACNLSLKM